jgi:MoxR-like ATPase
MSETLDQIDPQNDVMQEIAPAERSVRKFATQQERLDYIFSSAEVVLQELSAVGYMTNLETAYTLWHAYHLDLPIIQEGPAGAGKTQLALSVSKITCMRIIRLQCYPGITADMAIGRYNESLRQLYVLVMKDREIDFDKISREIMLRKFFITGPLLESIESPEKCILLIDEVDKVPHEFEAMLLELLSVWELSSPGLGTIVANTRPLTFLTSNNERDLADPLLRRSEYIEVKHPTALLEAQIVAYKTKSLPIETHLFIAGLAQALRLYPMKKHPSISEMSNIASAMQLSGLTTILPEHREIMLPLLAKRKKDIAALRMRDQFANLVMQANDYVYQVKLKLAVKKGILGSESLCLDGEAIRKSAEIRRALDELKINEFPEEEMKRIEEDNAAKKEKR